MKFKRAKILATVGPASNSYDTIEALTRAGANGFRLNFSHGSHDERDQQIAWIRQASKKLAKPVAILQDLQGPKIRLGDLDGNVEVKTGDELILEHGAKHSGNVLPVQYDLSGRVKKGQPVYLFDGKIAAEVVGLKPSAIKIKIKNDGILMSRKGLNLPETDFSGQVITEKDLRDLEYSAKQDIDYVALSFVQTAQDVLDLKQKLVSLGSDAKVIAKIETKLAIADENLEKIIKASDGVMVARGDLAVEAGPEVVPIVQRQIIGLCQKHGKLSIVATQMMASMVGNPEPTRAEVSDIAHAVITGADCLMLSDETANGDFPVQAVAAMKKVILYTQEKAPVRPIYFKEGRAIDKSDAISSAAVTLSDQLPAEAIVAETKSGATAFSIASHRPRVPIISVTSQARAAQQLALLYANKSFLRPDGERAGYKLAKELRANGFFDAPTNVVVVSGRQPGLTGGTDTIRVRRLD